MPRIFHLALVSADLYQYGALSCSESWGSLFSALEGAPHGGGKLSIHVKQGVFKWASCNFTTMVASSGAVAQLARSSIVPPLNVAFQDRPYSSVGMLMSWCLSW